MKKVDQGTTELGSNGGKNEFKKDSYGSRACYFIIYGYGTDV